MKIEPDSWLANVFGYPVFKVSPPIEKKDPTVQMQSWVAYGETAFFYAKVPTQQIAQVGALTAAGFNVVDVNVTFERARARELDWADTWSGIVREIRSDEHEAVLSIAESNFVYSRFHLDPQIPTQLANAVKRAWVNSYCQKQRGEHILVAEVGGKPAGFLAVLATTVNGAPTRVIDLIAVDKTQQRHGVGRALVDFFVRDSVGRAARLRVGTQAANIPSLQFYEKCGFRIAETTFVLHAHFRKGEVMR